MGKFVKGGAKLKAFFREAKRANAVSANNIEVGFFPKISTNRRGCRRRTSRHKMSLAVVTVASRNGRSFGVPFVPCREPLCRFSKRI